MVEVTGTNNNHIASVVVGCSVALQMVSIEVSKIVGITTHWLSHHVVSE
jgi:hypothetical protein